MIRLLRDVIRRMPFRPVQLVLFFSFLACLPLTALSQGPLAIKGGKVVPVVGDPIDEGIIVIRDGKIAAVGKDIPIPIEARVIDAKGKVVLPGFINPHTSQAVSQPNEVNPNVPFVSVIDAIDPSLEFFEDSRRNGVTSAAVLPGNNTMIGGQGLVVKTAGTFVNDMILKRDLGLKISLRPTSGRSRMSHLATLRAELEETKRYIQNKSKSQKDTESKKEDSESREEPRPNQPSPAESQGQEATPSSDAVSTETSDAQREALVRLLQGELPAFIYCDEAMDVPRALELADQYKLKSVLVLSPRCWKAAPLLSRTKPTVILDPTLVFWERDPRTNEDRQIILPKIYREAGIPFVFQIAPDGSSADTGGSGFGGRRLSSLTLGSNFFWYQAATAVKYGSKPAEALQSLTILPAKLLGIDSFVGSIEVGKDADLVLWTDDPLKANAWVESTLVDGRVVYERAEDKKLRDLLRPPTATSPSTTP